MVIKVCKTCEGGRQFVSVLTISYGMCQSAMQAIWLLVNVSVL